MHATKHKGDDDCTRCKKRKSQYRVGYRDSRPTEYVCLPCFQLMQTEEKRKPKAKGDVHVYRHTSNYATILVQEWVEKVLGGFTFSDCTLYVSLKSSQLKAGDVCLKIRNPKRPKGKKNWNKWIEGKVLVRSALKYPHSKQVATATCQIKDPVSLALLGPKDQKWFYEYSDIVFADMAEAYAWGAGYVMFKLLRITKSVPGLATKVGCRREAGVFLEKFRAWRKELGKSKTKKEVKGFVRAS